MKTTGYNKVYNTLKRAIHKTLAFIMTNQ